MSRAAELAHAQGVPDEVRHRVSAELLTLDGTLSPGRQRDVEQYLTHVLSVPWRPHAVGWREPVVVAAAVRRELRRHSAAREAGEVFIDHASLRALGAELGRTPGTGRRRGVALLLEGPPGVGKTRLAGELSKAAGTAFATVGFAGQVDAHSVRGFSRTWTGSGPSHITKALARAGRRDAVILLDEIDKLESRTRSQGGVADALLEVLDGSSEFRDDYLDLPLPLDDVCFIATANDADRIPDALLDRFEVVTVGDFTRQERELLVVETLWPEVLEEWTSVPADARRAGLRPSDRVSLTPAAARLLSAGSGTRDQGGVRGTRRKLARLLGRLRTQHTGEVLVALAVPQRPPMIVDVDTVVEVMPELRRHLG